MLFVTGPPSPFPTRARARQACGRRTASPRLSFCDHCAEAPAVPLLALTARAAKAEARLQELSETWRAPPRSAP